MILTGKQVADAMIEGVIDEETQTQPNGFDMTLLKVEAFKNDDFGILDFDNSRRHKTNVAVVPFDSRGAVRLGRGSYLITLDPKMSIPKDEVWMLKPRSSLVRMGAYIDAGVFDAGFVGRGQVLLTVNSLMGIKLYKDARIAQMVGFKIAGGEVEQGYSGTYQETHEPIDASKTTGVDEMKFTPE
jgi:dUTP pyrophosphatase